MRIGRVLLAILLFSSVCAPALPRSLGPLRDCCPDGETMECCVNQSGCSLETCDPAGSLPPPACAGHFVLPGTLRLVSPDPAGAFPASSAGRPQRPLLDQPDPPPRA